MTIKVFWQDPYLSRLDTRITGIDGNDVLVSETIFYALSGGQESDRGTIDERQVLEARKAGSGIIYTLEDAQRLDVGDPVEMQIDWSRRYALRCGEQGSGGLFENGIDQDELGTGNSRIHCRDRR